MPSDFVRFVRDDRAAATVEFVLWVPPMLFFLLLVTDASVLYLTHTEMFNVSREAARLVSVGELTADEVPDYVEARSLFGVRTYAVATYSGAVVVVDMQVNVGDASVFGFFRPVLDRTMFARVQMRREPTLVPPENLPSSV